MEIVDAILMSKVKSVLYYQPKLPNDNFFIEYAVKKKNGHNLIYCYNFLKTAVFLLYDLQIIYCGFCYSLFSRD